MDKKYIYYIMTGIFFLIITYSFATGTCLSYSAHIHDTGLQDYVISGHILKTITNADFGKCFRECSQTCHCRSFNLGLDGNGVCELNDVDKNEAPRALRARKGFVLVSFKALTQSTDVNEAKICCIENPCKNQALCVPEVRSGKRSFSCQCPPGFTGKLCDVPVKGCEDYLRANETAVSGVYTIWLDDLTMARNVYCYFDHINSEAWTLVMSYAFTHYLSMRGLPFQKDNAISEENPTFEHYRMSLALMQYLRNQSSFWRATCNHDTKPLEDDFTQSSFTTLDIMTYSEHKCGVLDVIRMYGTTYNQVNTFLTQDANRIFSIATTYGLPRCHLALLLPYGDDGLFNWFGQSVPQHGCASSSESTTQYWFGTTL